MNNSMSPAGWVFAICMVFVSAALVAYGNANVVHIKSLPDGEGEKVSLYDRMRSDSAILIVPNAADAAELSDEDWAVVIVARSLETILANLPEEAEMISVLCFFNPGDYQKLDLADASSASLIQEVCGEADSFRFFYIYPPAYVPTPSQNG